MTPRERDPMVWAATYAAAFARELYLVFQATDGTTRERRASALSTMQLPHVVATLTTEADAAVMALHPEGTYAWPSGRVMKDEPG